MKTRLLFPLICGLVAGIVPVTVANPSVSVAADATLTSSQHASPYSGSINEVVKLSQSGVDESVVLEYVKTASGPFQPSADEIIRLRDAGISSQVITAMLQRGGELRAQAPQTQTYAYNQSAYPPQTGAAQPAPAYSDAPVTYSTPAYAPSPTVVYSDYSYPVYYGSGYYPYYYGGYCYPYARYSCYPGGGFCAPGISIGFGFHNAVHFGGGFHGGFHTGGVVFHGGGGFHSGGFHGGFASAHVSGGHFGGHR